MPSDYVVLMLLDENLAQNVCLLWSKIARYREGLVMRLHDPMPNRAFNALKNFWYHTINNGYNLGSFKNLIWNKLQRYKIDRYMKCQSLNDFTFCIFTASENEPWSSQRRGRRWTCCPVDNPRCPVVNVVKLFWGNDTMEEYARAFTNTSLMKKKV